MAHGRNWNKVAQQNLMMKRRPTLVTKTDPMVVKPNRASGFKAKHPGTCAACGNRFEAGTMIRSHWGEGWAHLTCPRPRPVIPPEWAAILANPNVDPDDVIAAIEED